jgi:hypothetical protein
MLHAGVDQGVIMIARDEDDVPVRAALEERGEGSEAPGVPLDHLSKFALFLTAFEQQLDGAEVSDEATVFEPREVAVGHDLPEVEGITQQDHIEGVVRKLMGQLSVQELVKRVIAVEVL